jgi:hypothetical protein
MAAQQGPLWWRRLQALEPDPPPRHDSPATPTRTSTLPTKADWRGAHDRVIAELSPERLRQAREYSRHLQ